MDKTKSGKKTVCKNIISSLSKDQKTSTILLLAKIAIFDVFLVIAGARDDIFANYFFSDLVLWICNF